MENMILFLAIFASFVGILLSLYGYILYIIRAFGVSVGWGLAFIFLPFANLVFLFMHWEEAKEPFLISLIGGVISGAGVALVNIFGFQFLQTLPLP